MQILSRTNRKTKEETDVVLKGKQIIPAFDEFITARDYTGALTLLEVMCLRSNVKIIIIIIIDLLVQFQI